MILHVWLLIFIRKIQWRKIQSQFPNYSKQTVITSGIFLRKQSEIMILYKQDMCILCSAYAHYNNISFELTIHSHDVWEDLVERKQKESESLIEIASQNNSRTKNAIIIF